MAKIVECDNCNDTGYVCMTCGDAEDLCECAYMDPEPCDECDRGLQEQLKMKAEAE